MGNLTLIFLSASQLSLPVISAWQSKSKSIVCACRIDLTKSTQSFIISSSVETSLSIKNSKFDSFLGAPILFCALSVSNASYSSVLSSTDSSIMIAYCVFTNCKGSGAISVTSGCTYFVLHSSIFTNCTSSSAGGAVLTSSSSADCKGCCFYLCWNTGTTCYGSAISSSVTSSYLSNFTLCSAISCPEESGLTYCAVFRFYGGNGMGTYLNFSRCVENFVSGLYYDCPSTAFTASFLASYNQSTTSVFGSTNSPSGSVFEYGNVINTNCSTGFLYSNTAYCAVSKFVFINFAGNCLSDMSPSTPKVAFLNCIFQSTPTWGSGISGTSGCVYNGSLCNLMSISFLETYVCIESLKTSIFSSHLGNGRNSFVSLLALLFAYQ